MRFTRLIGWIPIALALTLSAPASGQEAAPAEVEASGAPEPGASYMLGPGDEINILALNAEEISNKPLRITTDGYVNLPMVGRIRAGGMTVEALENEIAERLKVYIRHPDVAVNVTAFQSQPVSVLGAVGSPGIVQLEGRKTLLEVLSLAGGLRDDHGSEITITRKQEFGPIPLPTATSRDSGHSVAELSVRSLIEAADPDANIQILPHDVIAVSAADIVYVIGQVRRPGGFTLGNRESLSVLQALALAEGLGETARAEDARIIRPVPESNPIEIDIDLKELLQGKTADMSLQPEDILFVPDSFTRGVLRSTLDAVIRATTGLVIYRW